jgi:phage-related protein
MPTVGAGVSEIRVQHNGQWRLMYVAKFEEGVYVLHAFRKTTQRTSPADIEVTRNRLRDLIKERRRNG